MCLWPSSLLTHLISAISTDARVNVLFRKFFLNTQSWHVCVICDVTKSRKIDSSAI